MGLAVPQWLGAGELAAGAAEALRGAFPDPSTEQSASLGWPNAGCCTRNGASRVEGKCSSTTLSHCQQLRSATAFAMPYPGSSTKSAQRKSRAVTCAP